PIFCQSGRTLNGFRKPDVDSNVLHQGTPQELKCGGHLQESVAAISYKPDAQLSPNERCVWTIKSLNATSYNLEVHLFGLQNISGETGIIATCIPEYGWWDPGLRNVLIDDVGVVNLHSDCLILPMFKIMTYTTTIGNAPVHPNTSHYIVAGGEGHIRHPPGDEEFYHGEDFSTFVFLPVENNYNPDVKTSVSFIMDGMKPDCVSSSLTLFRFYPNSGWSFNFTTNPEDDICDGVIYRRLVNDDGMLFLFYSFSGQEDRGFHLTYVNLPLIQLSA
ncbi:hypothetical protein Ocin01_18828, partial [Orchesella cincta]